MSYHTTPKANKEHKCFDCGLTIEKGEVYHRSVYFPREYDYDQLTEFKTHRFCHNLHVDYRERIRACSDEGTEFEEVLESFWKRNGISGYMIPWYRYERSEKYTLRAVTRAEKDPTPENVRIKDNCIRRMIEDLKKCPDQFRFDDEEPQ
jgi:hypothetical protein